MSNARFQTAADAFQPWREELLNHESPVLYRVGDGALAHIEIGPKLVTLIGGAPGAGKTALAMQFVIDALRLNPDLRIVVCNIEMPPTVLLDRQLSRLSGISAETIRYRKLEPAHTSRIDCAMRTLEAIADRLCFVRPPFDLANVGATVDQFDGKMILLDYIQRIAPPGEYRDRRSSVDATMSYLRQFADAGMAVLVVAAVARQKDEKGRSSYHADSLSLASFRESSELEFGADDAFILAPKGKSDTVSLRHLKARHTEPRDLTLRFDRRRQSFGVDEMTTEQQSNGNSSSALKDLWEKTPAVSSPSEDS